jgi:hypothetical protein
VEEPPFLVPVHGVVGGINIKGDLLRRRFMRLQEKRDEQALNARRIMGDLVIARCRLAAQFKTVEGRLPRHRCAVRSARLQLAGQHRHHRIVPRLVVIVDVLMARRDPEHPPPNQCSDSMFNQFRPPTIDEALGKAPDRPDRAIRRSQQQRPRALRAFLFSLRAKSAWNSRSPGVRRDRSTVKPRHNDAAFDRCKLEQFRATPCRHRGAPRIGKKSFSQHNFR